MFTSLFCQRNPGFRQTWPLEAPYAWHADARRGGRRDAGPAAAVTLPADVVAVDVPPGTAGDRAAAVSPRGGPGRFAHEARTVPGLRGFAGARGELRPPCRADTYRERERETHTEMEKDLRS